MSLKSLLTAATLIAGTSSAALANPVVSFDAGASFEYGRPVPVVNGSYGTPVVKGAEPCETPTQTGVILPAKLPVIEPMPLTRPMLVGSESRSFRGTETFWVGPQMGRFHTLKLEGVRSYVTDVKIHFADGH